MQSLTLRGSGAAVILAVPVLGLLVAACGGEREERTSRGSVAELDRLQRPVVKHLKLAFQALETGRDRAARSQLDEGLDAGENLVGWLEDHEDFAKQNPVIAECAEESIHELRERAERAEEGLEENRLADDDEQELRVRMSEVVNCIQSGD